MAAESVGLAASIAGLLSLGLQITGGIVKYMDAFEDRDEELRNVKKQNDNLGVTLHAMKTVLAGLQGHSPAVAAAVDQNIRSCEEDLRALEALCVELSDHAGSTWSKRLENKKKKVTFAFHRPKLRDLELQLQKAHSTLQLIQGSLGLEASNRNTALLAAIESSSRGQASEMLLVRSEVAAFATPMADVNNKLQGLQSVMTQTGQLVMAHSGAIESEIHESSQRVRYDIHHSHNSILDHLKTIDHKVQLLGEENSSLRALARKAASKPAVLKRLSPLHELTYQFGNWVGEAVEALSRANCESQPAISHRSLHDISYLPVWSDFSILCVDKFPKVTIAFECGPLSTAIINNDSDEVDRVLRRFPDSITELDIYERSPLHLAAAKPEILARLVKSADLSILNQRDRKGASALELAMAFSSRHCVNGVQRVRCKKCSCYLCAKILLDAGCDLVSMSVMPGTPHYLLHLNDVLEASSELARRHYIFQTSKRRRLQRTGHVLTNRSLSTKQEVGEERTTSDIQRGISQAPRQRRIYNEAEEAIESMSDWIFQQIWSVHLAQLFYRHGFMPKPSVFLQLLQSRTPSLWDRLTPEIVCWLLEHGGDLFLRSPAGPVNKTADDGVFAAHYVFYQLGRNHFLWLPSYLAAAPVSAIFERITVTCLNLTDGCCCPCSTKGCSSFTWLMKGFATHKNGSATPEQACLDHARRIADHFKSCGPELTLATYEEAIRFMTFEALDLFHSCCNTRSVVDEGAAWVDIDDTEVIEEQGLLLELHEELVVEFTREARGYLGDGPNGGILSTQFWRSYWTDRMTEELKKLNGGDLTATERRDAEEIGVIWDESTEGDEGDKCKGGNPYDRGDVEHYWFELDLICPEYNEPWPEGLRCIH
ncbi:hypothetical protein CPAR01_12853 [Colletotrichum paranaense]|uniref:Fungal N-terminal domain-containing protein n=1 Tax=Colletotrichum paranaense TaxID=1914294 RepID=A0ABQ9S8R6_9PEZI|nr:uncharacterized protein CPAR01_12853 [Colletotrichum paranaense]KAK1528295.1 hypothetical protein CPAR01_12853 [Colletotrichum paranaense]